MFMIEEFLKDLKYLIGAGGVLFTAGMLLQNAALFVTGFCFIGLTCIIEENTKNAYEHAKSKCL